MVYKNTKTGAKNVAKRKREKVDGLSNYDVAKIRSAVRQVWHRSYVRKLCVERCTGADGFFFCEICFERVPKIHVDHITPVGDLDGGFFERLFCPSTKLQGLCKTCHNVKTKSERRAKKASGASVPKRVRKIAGKTKRA